MAKFNSFKTLRPWLLTAALLPWVLTPQMTMAQVDGYTHYISDKIEVPMRRGAGTEYRIERMVPTGTPIKILETTDSWSRVELVINKRTWTGWVHQVAIQSEPPARLQLTEQQEKLTRLEARLRSLQTEHDTATENLNATSAELEKVKQERFEVVTQLEQLKSVSGNSVELDNQNREMRRMLTDLEEQNTILRAQINQSEDSVKRQWFITGAGVLLLGLLVGRLFRMPARRGSWDKI
jgi:SH3 domain protein